MAIVDLVQRSPEWFEWRKTGITASMIPVIMGLSPYQTPYQLWAELVGLKKPDDLSKNFHVQRGVEQEPEARNAVEQQYCKPYMPVCVQADHNPLFLASLDGLSQLDDQETEVLEIKCPHEKIYNEIIKMQGNAQTFKMYQAQVQWQLNCAGAQKGRLYFYLRGRKPISVGIPRDQTFIEVAEQAALAFWKLVQDKVPPVRIQDRDSIVYDNSQPDSVWKAKAAEYKEKKTYLDKVKAQADAIKKDLKSLESDFTKEVPSDAKTFEKEGIRATKVEREGSVNTASLIGIIEKEMNVQIPQELIDKARGKGSSYFKITVDENAEKIKVEQQPLEPVTNQENVEETSVQQMSKYESTQQEPTEFIQPMIPRNNYFEKSTQNMHF